MIGRIYKIIVSCSNEIYIGSTRNQLRHRWQEHKQDYKEWKDGDINKKPSSIELFEKYGIENCKIILIKEYEVVDKYHLRVIEQLWINKLRPINKNNPFCIGRFYRRDRYLTQKPRILEQVKNYYYENKDYLLSKNKEYRELKKEEIKIQRKGYRDTHKEQIVLRNKKWREENKEYVKTKLSQYYQENKFKLAEKVKCDLCNIEVSRSGFKKHEKSKKHTDKLNN